jgi:hypothetical protein
LGGYSVVSQTIALVDDMSTSLISAPMSGIFGFGFQSLAVSGATPWWQSLASSSAWSQPLFGVYLARYRDVPGAASTEAQGGKLTLGYLDSSLYSGDITYVSVTEQRYWNVPIAGEFATDDLPESSRCGRGADSWLSSALFKPCPCKEVL